MGQKLSHTAAPFTPLEIQDRHIRLLTLFPSSDESATIECSVAPHSLNWNPAYEALSYTWGDPGDICASPIYISGQPTYISTNLEAALHALRYHDHIRVLWIDALCIDQKNASEKCQQIAMMGTIYEAARNVVVWLGTQSHNSDLAMATIANLNSITDLEHVTEEAWGALEDLFSRPWFSRIWVLQEFKRGHNPYFQCGRATFNWDRTGESLRELWISDHWMGSKQIKLLGEIGKVVSMASTRLDVPVGSDIDTQQAAQYLVRMLRVYGGRNATEAHDKIYGLLGLSDSFSFSSSNPPKIDYNRPVLDVYTDWARFLILTQNSLDLLYVSQRMHHDAKLPSWVPDWRISRHDLLLTLDVFRTSFNYKGLKPAEYNSAPRFEETRSGNLLYVQGYIIATFTKSFMFFPPDLKFIASKLSLQPQRDLLLACLMMGCKLKNASGTREIF